MTSCYFSNLTTTLTMPYSTTTFSTPNIFQSYQMRMKCEKLIYIYLRKHKTIKTEKKGKSLTVHLYCHPHKQTQGRTEVGTFDLLLYPQLFNTCLQFLVPETDKQT